MSTWEVKWGAPRDPVKFGEKGLIHWKGDYFFLPASSARPAVNWDLFS